MNDHDFTLTFAIPDALGRETLEARLFTSSCDDASIGTGQPDRLALSFTRRATTAPQAVESAIQDVRQAVPDARLVEADPDRVGVSDIAALFAFSRQNMRKLVQTHRESFPLPLHEGRASLWHLADVLDWFADKQGRSVDTELREVAYANMQVNAAREARRLQQTSDDMVAM